MTTNRTGTRHKEDLELVTAHLASSFDPDDGGAVGRSGVSDRLAMRLGSIPKFLTVINRRRGGPLLPEAVEDLSQDVLVEVLGKLATFRGESSLESWLYRIASRRYSNRIRDLARQSASFDDYALELRDSCGSQEAFPAGEAGDALPEATGLLPPKSRAILEGKWVRGLTFQEIAREVGGSVSTIKTRYYRSLTLLANSLGLTGPK